MSKQLYNGIKLIYSAPNSNGTYDVKTAEIDLPTFDETDQFVTDSQNKPEHFQNFLREIIQIKVGDTADGEIGCVLKPIMH